MDVSDFLFFFLILSLSLRSGLQSLRDTHMMTLGQDNAFSNRFKSFLKFDNSMTLNHGDRALGVGEDYVMYS